ncbi:MAG: hypothetical protein II852_01320 [Bacteroidales bacterium]|jgi:LSD1 subclass zinc finger protein|nr:hypothetical protein [Bacteroidales bacterium]
MADSQNQIKCKQCGGTLMFAPGTTSLQCEFCGAMNEIDRSNWDYAAMTKKHNFLADVAELPDAEVEVVHSVKCNCCGAQTTFNSSAITVNCDFCGSPIAVSGDTSTKRIKPQGVIPFMVSQDQGRQKFAEWIKGLWFAPGDLINKASMESGLTGMYIPYWLYYVDTVTSYTGKRGEYYYTEKQVKQADGSTKTEKERHTRWHPTSGTVSKNFKDLIISGSNTLGIDGEKLKKKFKFDGMVPYNEQTLTGYKSENYSVSLKDAYKEAQKIMAEEIEDAIEKDIGGDDQQIDNKNITENNIEYKHILAPLWISAFRYEGKSYRFMINGQTGDLSGSRPYSKAKIALFIGAIVAVIALIVILLK